MIASSQLKTKNKQVKKISLTAISILLLTAYSYCQSGKNILTTTIKGSGNALDTIITRKTELSLDKTFPNNYKRDEAVVQVLRPYLVSEIVDPGNRSHPVYLDYVKDARKKLPEAKSALLQRIKSSSSYREYISKYNIANEADLNSITFVHIPVYYMTPNIVFLKNGDNIAKYYNLVTGGLKYLMLRNNRLIGYLDFYNGKSSIIWMPNFIAEGYHQILKLGKTPIVPCLSVGTRDSKEMLGGINMFGYMDQGHLILSICDEGIVQNAGYGPKNPVFRKNYTLETAESFFSGNGGRSTINQWLDNAVNSLKTDRKRE
jgi:hypothetical protein